MEAPITGASVPIVVAPEVTATGAHGIGGSAAVAIQSLAVAIGADQTERTSTIAVESGLVVSLESTIPVYAVGLISPVVYAYLAASTTVRGTAAVQVSPGVAIYAGQMLPLSANIFVRARVSIAANADPVIDAAIIPPVEASVDGLVVTHGRAAITIPSYVSAQARVGFTGNVSATIRAVFSAPAVSAKSATVAIAPVVSVSAAANTGRAISCDISPPVGVSVLAGSFSDIQISGAISIPAYPYIRCTFNDNSAYADCAYVLTKQNSVAVLQ